MASQFAGCIVAVAVLGAWAQSSPSSVDLLNYALQLEYLGAQFYSCAASGRPLDSALTGGSAAGPLTGCQRARLDSVTQLYAEQLASNQLAHVTWLRQQLGPLAMPSPAIDISSPFAAIADLAVDSIVYPPFTPYADPLSFVLGAYLLEPVGASAYLGVLPALAGNSSLQAAFSGFFGVEAAHAGAASAYVLQQASALLPSTNVTVADFTGLLAAFLDDGTPDAQGIITQQKGTEEANLVPANSNAMLYGRAPEQVVGIIAQSAANGTGSFYPQGFLGYYGTQPGSV